MKTPSSREFLLYWLKFGFLSFGGPAAQISMLHRDLVEERKWIGDQEFSDALGFVSLLPGPEAHQLATYIGRKFFGIKGGIIAGGLFLIPSLFIVSALTWLYLQYSVNTQSDIILEGLRTGVLALILYTAIRLAKKITWTIRYLLLFTLLLGLNVLVHLPVVALVLFTLLIGWISSRNLKSETQASIQWTTSIKVILIGVSLWLLTFALIYPIDDLRNLAFLFSQAALITFGGAYSVVPFVSDASVNTYGWLTQAQMLDGLALGETTPGPLIMINAFIGFIAYKGFIGALAATWFTFLPSFILVFAGAPIMQSLLKSHPLRKVFEVLSVAVVSFIAGFALTVGEGLQAETRGLQVLVAGLGVFLLTKTRMHVILWFAIAVFLYVIMRQFLG